ncbi:hypothetical protein EVAR_14387_1 [Eumeta japonica]|uniref:Uncharacterized protein n=1 Tax=Eumeta variegata TaxID=151549 RepID=A0A4C1TX76_EUMVA|nr:hypothetical protein EVAR_14387_1 [Eumeta japonica]
MYVSYGEAKMGPHDSEGITSALTAFWVGIAYLREERVGRWRGEGADGGKLQGDGRGMGHRNSHSLDEK